jgi:hypothetical protein
MRYIGCNFKLEAAGSLKKSTHKDGNMTDIAGNETPPIAPSQTDMPSSPLYAPVADPPKKKGSSTLKIVLIIVGVCVGLGIIGAGVVGYGVYKMAKSSNITTSAQPVTESDMGVALYPGAESKANVRMTIAGKDMHTASFSTSDPKDQAIAFYQSKLGPDAKSSTSSRGETLMLDKGAGESVLVTVSQSPNMAGGKTQIVVVHATKAAHASQNGSSN